MDISSGGPNPAMLDSENEESQNACDTEPSEACQPDIHAVLDEDGINLHYFNRYEFTRITKSMETRLLRIPGRKTAECVATFWAKVSICEIMHIDLKNEDLKYETLSYAWGDSKITEEDYGPIFISTPKGISFMLVTLHLFRAIIYLQQDTEDRYLWIDQICINQCDLAERAKQILLMPEIFLRSFRTVVWLGAEEQGICKIYEMMFNKLRTAAGRQEIRELIKADDPKWAVTLWFFAKPWFTRLWVFQEVVLSSAITIYCGRSEWDFDTIIAARDSIEALGPKKWTLGIKTLHIMRCFRFMYQNARSSIQLLHLQYDVAPLFNCFDPRDKIFALLGIVPPNDPLTIPVDYTVSTSEVYTNAAHFLASSTDSLHHLACINYDIGLSSISEPQSRGGSGGDVLHLPSWVPDWTRKEAPRGIEMPTNVKFRASAGRPYKHSRHRNASLLQVRGKIIDKVLGVIDFAFEDFDTSNLQESFPLISIVMCLMKYLDKEKRTESVVVELSKAVIKTAIADGVFRVESPKRPTSESELENIINIIYYDMKRPSLNLTDKETADLNSACENITVLLSICHKRRLAAVHNYGLALMPRAVREGDSVCILHGSSVPVLVRSVGERYIVLSQCYVEETMYGEAVNWEEDEADTFILE